MTSTSNLTYISTFGTFWSTLSNASGLYKIGNFSYGYGSLSLYTINDTLLAGISRYTIYIINVTDAQNPSIYSQYQLQDSIYYDHILVNNDLIFLWDEYQGMRIVNHTNFQNFAEIGSIDMNFVQGLAIYNQKLYFGTGYNFMRIYDIGNLHSNITEMSLLKEIPKSIKRIYEHDGMLFMASSNTLSAHDLAQHPLLDYGYHTTFEISIIDMYYWDGYLGLALDEHGFTILNIGSLDYIQNYSYLNDYSAPPGDICSAVNSMPSSPSTRPPLSTTPQSNPETSPTSEMDTTSVTTPPQEGTPPQLRIEVLPVSFVLVSLVIAVQLKRRRNN